jgi:hypothetical protein
VSNDQQAQQDRQQPARCNLCYELKHDVQVNVCLSCVEGTLRRLVPQLTGTLEEIYGRLLDEWLETGRFTSASLTLKPQFRVSKERARRFVTDLVTDALGEEAIALSLPRCDGWVPSLSDELTDAVYERCGEGLRLLITHTLAEALGGLPTKAAERELIETAIGRRRSDTPRRRQAAVEAAAFSSASPLPGPAKALLELRHGADCRHFTECWEGKIDPVWREVAELLPAEVAALIPAEETAG